MRAKRSETPSSDAVRGDIDALASRIDTLAAIVRETSGALAATRGEVASVERRVDERLREDSGRVGAALTQVRDELAALRGSPQTATTAAQPLDNELSVLTDRVETLSSMVGETAGRLAAGEGNVASIRDLVTGEGARVDVALAEIKRELAALATKIAAVPRPAAAPKVKPDGRVDALGDRVTGLAEIVRETAGGLAAASGAMAGADGRIGALEARLEERSTAARQATTTLELELSSLREQLAANPAAATRVELLADQVQTLGDRLDTVSQIVASVTGRAGGSEENVESLERRLTLIGDHVATLATELREQVVPAAAVAPAGIDEAELERRIEPIAQALTRFTTDVGDTAEAVDRLVTDLRVELGERIHEVEREQVALRSELTSAVSAHESESAILHGRIDEVATVANAALERPAADMTPALDALTAKLETIDEERSELHRRIDELSTVAERALARPVSEPLTGLREVADRLEQIESDRVALERRIDDLAAVTHDAREIEVSDPGPLLSVLAAKLQLIESDRDALTTRIDELAVVAHEALARPMIDPTPMLQELTVKLERIEAERQTTATALVHAEATWVQERTELRARLDAISQSALGPRADEDAHRLVRELTIRLDRLERGHESVSELHALAEGWTNSLAVLAARVDYGLLQLERTANEPEAASDPAELTELAERVAAMEGDRNAVVEQLARATEAWASERAALQERVSELAARIVTGPVDSDAQIGTATLADPTPAQELDRLRIGLEGMRMRLAYHEKTVSEMGAKSIVERLDELGARLERVQQVVAAGGAPIAWANTIPLPDADLGGLLNRVEQAERSVKSGREDILLHLERLASRMDWRLQRLESGDTSLVSS